MFSRLESLNGGFTWKAPPIPPFLCRKQRLEKYDGFEAKQGYYRERNSRRRYSTRGILENGRRFVLLTFRGPAFIIIAHRSFFRHLLSRSRVDFTGDAPGIAVTRTHFKSEACVSMLRAGACTGDIPPPVTNNTGWTSSWEGETCWKPIMHRVFKTGI